MIKLKLNRGYSLIELMVAITIGLLISSVAVAYLVNSSRSFNVSNIDARVQENGFFGLEVLTQNIRIAGFHYVGLTDTPSYLANRNICPDSDGAGNATACLGDAVDGVSDRIAFEAVTRNPIPNAGIMGGGGVACDGTALNQTVSELYVNVFWVGNANLNCQTINVDAGNVAVGATTPLVQGVDSMQIQYGLDMDSDGSVDSYMPFTELAAPLADSINRVRAIRVALLVNSGLAGLNGSVTDTQANRNYTLLDAPVAVFNDSSRREIYTTTVMLPNYRN